MRPYVLLVAGLWLGASYSPLAASGEAHKALIREFVEAVNTHELGRLDAVVAANFVRHSEATPDVDVRSLEDFKAFLAANRAVFPDEQVTLDQLVAEGDRVAYWGAYSGTQEGQMGPFPPSGRLLDVDISGVFRIESGKIAELWITWDNLAGLVQLGHFPPPPCPD